MDSQLDSHFVGLLENKLEKSRFVRVDADVIDNLILKADKKTVELTGVQRDILTELFSSQLPKVDDSQFFVNFEAMNATDAPIVITQNEYMRRMKEMSAMQAGMNFYGEMPNSYSIIVNTENAIVKSVSDAAFAELTAMVEPIAAAIAANNSEINQLDESKKKDDADKVGLEKQISELRSTNDAKRGEQNRLIDEYAATQPLVGQIIDLALLGNGMLRGADLSKFISRSLSLLEK
jgi:molecular chaperone HtpG